MPYVIAEDRKILDPVIESVANEAAQLITNNFSLINTYGNVFSRIAFRLSRLVGCHAALSEPKAISVLLAETIFDVARKYNDEGSYLGGLNYSITRFIQRVPQIKVENGAWKGSDEFRYRLYACTIEALTKVATEWQGSGLVGIGIGGVFEDVKDEYKRRVNTAYEAAQIVKNGDCYDTPYYTKLIEVIDSDGHHVGYQEVMVKRSHFTVGFDTIPYCQIVASKKRP